MMEFQRELGPQLEDLRSKGLFCDVTIVFPKDDKKLHVHRNILASCSSYFRSLFTYNMTTSGNIEIEIPGMTYSDMEAIVQFAYTHKVELNPDNIESIIVIADRLNVLGLLKICCEYLIDHMNIDNAIGIYQLAKYLQCHHLVSRVLRYIQHNFVRLSTGSNEFLQLSHEELAQILKADELMISSEDYACAAVVKWVDFLTDIRLPYLPQLLRAVRLGLVSKDALAALLQRFKDLSNDSEADVLLQKGHELSLRRTELSRPLLTQALGNPMLRPRIPSEVIFVLGGWSRDGVCSDMETFDNRVDKWYENESESYEYSLAYHAMVTVDQTVYVIGGYTTVKYLNSAKKFDPTTKTWSQIAPMHSSRCYVCAAEVKGEIYACGGYDGNNRHCSVEKYSPECNQWQLVADMHSVRSDAGATGLGGKLYVAGGFSGTECLNSAESFDPSTNQWTILARMGCQRSGVTVVTFQNEIYAIGGFDGQFRLNEVEKYHPETHAWFPVKEMLKGRSNFAATVIENRIYVIGGYDGSGTTGHVEYFQYDRDEWCEASSLGVGRSAASAVTLTGLENVKEFTFYGKEAHLLSGGTGESDDKNEWQVQTQLKETPSKGVCTRSRAKRSA